jgi:hypothetical protein
MHLSLSLLLARSLARSLACSLALSLSCFCPGGAPDQKVQDSKGEESAGGQDLVRGKVQDSKGAASAGGQDLVRDLVQGFEFAHPAVTCTSEPGAFVNVLCKLELT